MSFTLYFAHNHFKELFSFSKFGKIIGIFVEKSLFQFFAFIKIFLGWLEEFKSHLYFQVILIGCQSYKSGIFFGNKSKTFIHPQSIFISVSNGDLNVL
jgi:hypothetical protein